MDAMRTRAEEPEPLDARQLAAAASMTGGVSNQALAQAATAGQANPAALAELARAANGSQAAGALFADHPGRSADGLGTIGWHGAKPSSNRNGPQIHWTESEHVIPFAIGARVWELLSMKVPGRGKAEDKEQTTIMIYKGAADRKTAVDKQVIKQFKAEFAESGLASDMSAEMMFAQGGGGDGGPVRALLADMVTTIEAIRADAVERTVRAVAEENRAIEAGYTLSNGERRAEPSEREPDLPTADDIESASQTQFDDIIGLAEQAVSALD
jgi:hypothetical protein